MGTWLLQVLWAKGCLPCESLLSGQGLLLQGRGSGTLESDLADFGGKSLFHLGRHVFTSNVETKIFLWGLC